MIVYQIVKSAIVDCHFKGVIFLRGPFQMEKINVDFLAVNKLWF